jgi:transposase-like protein
MSETETHWRKFLQEPSGTRHSRRQAGHQAYLQRRRSGRSRSVAHRKRLRTNNGLERLNKAIIRRTRVATLFPNEASLLRLVSAVLSEISDDWETERSYLNMERR